MSDAASGTYRPKEELEHDMEERDPIVILRNAMKSANELSDDDFTKMDDEVKAVAQDAWDFADNEPEPGPEALYEHVLADTTSDELEAVSAT
jgi:pyruvate dehydrogenase E1 component alpha subunit